MIGPGCDPECSPDRRALSNLPSICGFSLLSPIYFWIKYL